MKFRDFIKTVEYDCIYLVYVGYKGYGSALDFDSSGFYRPWFHNKYIDDWVVYNHSFKNVFLKGRLQRELKVCYMYEYDYNRMMSDKETEIASHYQIVGLFEDLEVREKDLYKQYNMFGGVD